ncbi:MAG: hypothetical protein QOC96_1094 [Acidobacteriota bacterium]|jgi:hypothetical protein|nr:hypothetical protein [Acidobacteriota bacterium]
MSSQKSVQKNENGFKSFGRTRKRRLRVHRKASSMRNVRRKITASAVLLSILILAFPFTKVTQVGLARENVEAQGGLPQQDIDAINVLAAFNIGTPYQPPQTLPSGVVMATAIGADAGFPSLLNGPLKSVKELLPMVREAAIRLLRYYSGGTFLAPTSVPPPYTRKTYTLFHSRFANSPALARCEKEEGVGNCEEVKPNPRDAPLAYPKCKPGFTGAGEMCNPISNAKASPKDEELISKVIRNAASDPVTRRKLAPYMLQVAWEALATDNPTPTQQAFYQYFQYYAGWQNQQVTQRTLVQWCKHKKNWPKTPLSVLIGTGNAKSEGFKPEPMPMSIGRNGGLEMDKLLTPAVVTDLARRDPSWQANLPNLVADGKPMDTVLTQLGFTQPAAAAIMTSMLGNLPDGWPGSKLPLAEKVQDLLKEAAIKAATKIAEEVAVKITEAILVRLIGTAVGEAIGEGLGLPAAIIAIALEVLIKNIIAEVETPKFEAELIKGSREAEPVDVRELIHTSKPGYGDGLKIGVMSHLIKMMIVDPADGTRFGPTQFVVIDPLQQALAAKDVCGGLEQQGLLQ